ncbi:sugar phosphate isomerase/epimerase family protein [Streptomyces sp. NPDC058067]|uniref:sugar phosphate isomerase/epimerase family protein n=1 Tax=Streptomyces sp. NPDC058067 TaxID=3346324 RepID=UPI0036E34D36
MLRIGVDSSKFGVLRGRPAVAVLEHAADRGLEGVYFRSVLELSPDLEPAEVKDVMRAAHDLGQRVEAGVGKVNPFATPETPEIRALGDGDYLRGMRRMIEVAASAGIRELWTATANYQFRLPDRYAYDRFRTDVGWDEQLAATERFLHKLAPVLRDLGVHLNIETHEEITTFELVRLVEAVGPDVVGITFDTANVLMRCEDPVAAVERAAPYIRATHIRDAALFFTPAGIARQLVPVGEGVLDWDRLLAPLAGRDLMLSVEGIVESTRGEMELQLYDPVWQEGHPDLTLAEAFEVVRLTTLYADRVSDGAAASREQLHRAVGEPESLAFIDRSAQHLRQILARTAGQEPTPDRSWTA